MLYTNNCAQCISLSDGKYVPEKPYYGQYKLHDPALETTMEKVGESYYPLQFRKTLNVHQALDIFHCWNVELYHLK